MLKTMHNLQQDQAQVTLAIGLFTIVSNHKAPN